MFLKRNKKLFQLLFFSPFRQIYQEVIPMPASSDIEDPAITSVKKQLADFKKNLLINASMAQTDKALDTTLDIARKGIDAMAVRAIKQIFGQTINIEDAYQMAEIQNDPRFGIILKIASTEFQEVQKEINQRKFDRLELALQITLENAQETLKTVPDGQLLPLDVLSRNLLALQLFQTKIDELKGKKEDWGHPQELIQFSQNLDIEIQTYHQQIEKSLKPYNDNSAHILTYFESDQKHSSEEAKRLVLKVQLNHQHYFHLKQFLLQNSEGDVASLARESLRQVEEAHQKVMEMFAQSANQENVFLLREMEKAKTSYLAATERCLQLQSKKHGYAQDNPELRVAREWLAGAQIAYQKALGNIESQVLVVSLQQELSKYSSPSPLPGTPEPTGQSVSPTPPSNPSVAPTLKDDPIVSKDKIKEEPRMGGKKFIDYLASLPKAERDQAIWEQVEKNNYPSFLNPEKFKKMVIEGYDLAGVYRVIEFSVALNYFAVGTDEDYVMITPGPAVMAKIYAKFKVSPPTPKLVQHLYDHVQENPQEGVTVPFYGADELVGEVEDPQYNNQKIGFKWSDQNASPRERDQYQKTWKESPQLFGAQNARIAPHYQPGELLVVGHKEDVVLVPGLHADKVEKKALFGGWYKDGKQVQKLFKKINSNPSYAEGVRFVSNDVVVDGQVQDYQKILQDPYLHKLMSDQLFGAQDFPEGN